MRKFKKFGQQYVDWVIKLGRVKFSLFGFFVLATFALFVQCLLSFVVVGKVYWEDVIRSISFGLISAPFTIYFFTLLVEKLELSRVKLADSVTRLKKLRERDAELNQKLSENITTLHKTQTELVQQAEFLRSFIDASPDLVFYRSEGRFLGCNRAFEILAGKTEKEIINLPLSNIFPPEIEKYTSSTDKETLQTNDGITYEQWFKYPNGKSACFEIRKVPYFDRIKERHCIMGFGRDITAHKHYQEVIEKANRDKTTFMATISHELRTPLNAIVGLSQILLDGKLSDEQRNYLKTINVSAVSLGHIFSDIIDLEKIDARRIKLAKSQVDLRALLNDIGNFGHLMAEQKKLAFNMQYVTDLPNWVMLDRARISQILWNLINNAVKFTESGEVKLSVSINVENKLCFKISDTGIGIPKNELVKIFAMYYQVKSPYQNNLIGSGIGLSISKRIAKLMGGDLTVESEVGKGSLFTLEIPCEKVVKPIETYLPNIAINLHILLVEDIDVNIIVAKSVLEKLGYSVDIAKTGQEALKKFKQKYYDLVFLDIQLPDMSGFDIAQNFRQKYEEGEYDYLPPLIALTANVIHNKEDYIQKGMDDVLRKPLSLDSLTYCLSEYFSEDNIEDLKFTTKKIFIRKNSHFNDKMLNELIEMLGVQFLKDNLTLFKQTMLDYIKELQNQFNAYQNDVSQKKQLIAIAHKIKGAAASVGLQRIQQIAQKAQSGEREDWEQKIAFWINELSTYWLVDAEELEQKLSVEN